MFDFSYKGHGYLHGEVVNKRVNCTETNDVAKPVVCEWSRSGWHAESNGSIPCPKVSDECNHGFLELRSILGQDFTSDLLCKANELEQTYKLWTPDNSCICSRLDRNTDVRYHVCCIAFSPSSSFQVLETESGCCDEKEVDQFHQPSVSSEVAIASEDGLSCRSEFKEVDKVNIKQESDLLFAGDGPEGALWYIFRKQDVPKLQQYLGKYFREFRHMHCSPLKQGMVQKVHCGIFFGSRTCLNCSSI